MAARVNVVRTVPGVSIYDDPQPLGGDFAQELLTTEHERPQNRRVEIVLAERSLVMTGRIRESDAELSGRARKMVFKEDGVTFQVWTGLDWKIGNLIDRAEAGTLDRFLEKAFSRIVVTGDEGGTNALGTNGADRMMGSGRSDGLHGMGGKDKLFGGAGHDDLNGNGGDDRILGAGGDDQLRGDAGEDKLFGGAGYDNLGGGAGDDRLSGGVGGDVLAGDGGNDRLGGWKGRDRLFGGEGDDELYGSAGRDRLRGGEGNDSLYGGKGSDTLSGGEGIDLLVGGKGDDFLASSDAGDEMRGGDGDDELVGGTGAQTLNGGAGDDRLLGLGGVDAFDFRGAAFGTDVSDIDMTAGETDGPGGSVAERLLLDAGAAIEVHALEHDGRRVYAFDVMEGGAAQGTVITLIDALEAADPGAEAERLSVQVALEAAVEQDVLVL